MLCNGRRAAVGVIALCCALCAPVNAKTETTADVDEEENAWFIDTVYPIIKDGKNEGFKMAHKYREDRKYSDWDTAKKIAALRKEVCLWNGVYGALGNSASLIPGYGTLGSVASIGASTVLSFRSQAKLAGGIASLKGWEKNDERTDYFILGLIVGDAATVAMATGGAEVGKRAGAMVIKSLPTSAVRLIQQKLGRGGAAHLLGAKAGPKAAANAALQTLPRFVPMVGMVFAGATDGGLCYAAGLAMENMVMPDTKELSQLKKLLTNNQFTSEQVRDITDTLGYESIGDLCYTKEAEMSKQLSDLDWKIGQVKRFQTHLDIACAERAARNLQAARNGEL